LYIFGGCDGNQEYGTLFKIKLQNSTLTKCESKGDVPSARYGHTAVIYKDFMYVFGGWDGTRTLNDFYQFSFSKYRYFFLILHFFSLKNALVSKFWYIEKPDMSVTPVSSVPSPRYRHSSCVVNKSIFIFGGISKLQEKHNDLYEYRIAYSAWRKILTSLDSIPSPRTFHQICAKKNCDKGSIYLFGGSSSEKLNDFYWILDKDFWKNCQGPPEKIGYGKN
jgi:N-acetylneuraminic acid mutarotase